MYGKSRSIHWTVSILVVLCLSTAGAWAQGEATGFGEGSAGVASSLVERLVPVPCTP